MSAASSKADLGDPIGRGRFILVFVPELDEIGRQLVDCDVFIYSYLCGFRTAAAGTLIALLPFPKDSGFDSSRGYFAETVCRWTDLLWHRCSGGLKGVGSP
jgi:hypothetical protein